MAAFKAASSDVPREIRNALEDALEIALSNVPEIEGRVVVCPDVSGSMGSPVSGYRGSVTSAIRCIDVAGLVAAAMLRKNPEAMVIPFAGDVVRCDLNPRDTVMTNAQKLAALGGGATSCSAPLALMVKNKVKANLVVYVSDNESWIDARQGMTATMQRWNEFRVHNPQARLVCIDCTPNATSQAIERDDVLNIGGFSDDVFKIIAAFAAGQLGAGQWVGEIEAVGM